MSDNQPMVFVFGSRLAGRHGKGAAPWAWKNRGAIYGRREGYQGCSYAIPTKDAKIKSLHLNEIAAAVHRFIAFAKSRPDWSSNARP